MNFSRELPSRLYKYASLQGYRAEWVKQLIDCHEIYFAAASAFNDPFDSKITADLITPQEILAQCESTAQAIGKTLRTSVDHVDSAAEHPNLNKTNRQSVVEARDSVRAAREQFAALQHTIVSMRAQINRVVQQFQDTQEMLYKVGILCLTESPDNMLMWSHYADCHRGVCFEFDTSYEPFANAAEVRYQITCPGLDYQEIVFTKLADWQYEHEWRILSRPPDGGGLGVHKFPSDALIGIICGCKMEEDMYQKVSNWAAESNVPLKRAVLSRGKYAIKIQD